MRELRFHDDVIARIALEDYLDRFRAAIDELIGINAPPEVRVVPEPFECPSCGDGICMQQGVEKSHKDGIAAFTKGESHADVP